MKGKRQVTHYYRNLESKDPPAKPTTVRFGKKLDKKLVKYSKKHKLPMSTIVRQALWKYLK